MTKCRFPSCLDCCTLDFTVRKLRNIVIKNCESSKILKHNFLLNNTVRIYLHLKIKSTGPRVVETLQTLT